MSMIEFNVNNYVEFVLTKSGAEIWNARYKKYAKYTTVVRIVVEGDALREQLWYVMQVFGEHIHLGGEVPFKECLLRFEVKD